MGVLDVPKALYKAQQAKSKMSKINAAGVDGSIGILINGLTEVKEVEVDVEKLMQDIKPVEISTEDAKKIAKVIAKNIKNAMNNAKKSLEKEMIKSTDLDDLKGLLGG